MEFLRLLYEAIRHLGPETLNALATYAGPWLYVVLFAIIFAETGLVVTPFLPGDSLLFAVGALAATAGSPINLPMTGVLLVAAAILGDAVNYAIGLRLGPKVFAREDSKLLNKQHLYEAQRFYEKHGGRTIILARFVPIVRTFAPFVAGIGRMGYARFAAFNVAGGLIWILTFLLAGYGFGNLPIVKRYFHLVIGAIIVISVLPAIYEVWKGRRAAARGHSALLEATTPGEDSAKLLEAEAAGSPPGSYH